MTTVAHVFVFDQPDQADQPVSPGARRRGIWLAVVLLTLLGAVALGATWQAERGGETFGFVCGYKVTDDKAQEEAAQNLCRRKSVDQGRRARFRQYGPDDYAGTAKSMHTALSRALLCPRPTRAQCTGWHPERAATDADVVTARNALTSAGLAYSVVRLAADDDPAPATAVVYALLMGDRCVIGYLDPHTGATWSELVGLLPDGRCLSS